MEYVAGFICAVGIAICGVGGIAITMLIVAWVLDYAVRHMWKRMVHVHGLARLNRAAEIIRQNKGDASNE